MRAFIGVDVGTGSARAGIFDSSGRLLATARRPIAIWHEPGDVVEQSSDDIWQACAQSIREAMGKAKLAPEAIAGIGFDATCSLVVLDAGGAPVTVSTSGDRQRNVIVWMDHRATGQAQRINATNAEVLRYVGGVISPEMETPKLLWLKENLPASYHGAGHFLDLADFLTFRATGSTKRSVCTVTCKWTFLAHEGRWDDGYFERVGLSELAADGHAKIGSEIVETGVALGSGLTREAAADFGLNPGTPVGASLIDAHAGGVGTIGATVAGEGDPDIEDRLAYIMGTSACIMATTAEPRFLPGIWGPYYSAMVPGFWLNEGGQSAAGAGIDHLMRAHPARAEAQALAEAEGVSLLEFLERRAIARSPDVAGAALLARDLHVLPEFLGNRSPHADPEARAVIAGLDLSDSVDSLEKLFVAGLCGLAYGLADVVDAMRARGIDCSMMVMSGGASRSKLVRQIMADTTGLTVALPQTSEPVLLGAAMLGAVAGGAQPTLSAAMAAMSSMGELTRPSTPALQAFHATKRRVYTALQAAERASRDTMATYATASRAVEPA